jgi:hypothetical protein
MQSLQSKNRIGLFYEIFFKPMGKNNDIDLSVSPTVHIPMRKFIVIHSDLVTDGNYNVNYLNF